MLLERLGHADGRIRHGDRGRGLLLGLLNARLDLADVVQVVAEARLVLRAEAALQILHVVSHRVENALVGLHPGETLLAGAGAAEHPLEGCKLR